ncbi:hypothetical protein B0H21DRAFT_76663 [Amylocystis lapponica]|nr:hypothetical protein B0H21DRAFT_76663 [Amylocystis lapponica]
MAIAQLGCQVLRLEGLVRSDFWFADGNIVLLVGRAAFKVHRGQLERQSDVFRDLFLIPQPPNQETIDGCFWVELHDSASDVLFLLRALYDGLYFKQSSAHDFPAIAAVLRLSTKYLIDTLRERCLLRLESDWPSTLASWDGREKQATDALGRYTPREVYPHPILVIQLASELGLDGLLASALYDLSRYAPRKILSGTSAPPPSLPPDAPALPPSDAPVPVHLTEPEVIIALLGRETGQRYLAAFIETELSARALAADCANRHHDGGRACRESFYFVMLNVLRAVGGIACGRDADPLFALVQAADMLERTDFSDGVRQCGLRMCGACKADFRGTVEKAREEVWTLIPVWFGLRPARDAPRAEG